MYQEISQYDFTEAFRTMNREDNFTYAGLQALFEYLEELEESTGEKMELDVIAICCDFSEYPTALEAAEQYGFQSGPDDDEDEREESAKDYLADNTSVIDVGTTGVIIQDY
jgi:hypothetical protein